MNSDISPARKTVVVGWTLGFALVMGLAMSPFTLHVFRTFFPSPAVTGEMLFGLVPLLTAQTYALQALFILVELISTNLFVGVWRARGPLEAAAKLGAAVMIALLGIGAAWTDNRTVAHAQVEANNSREIAGRTQPEVDRRNRDALDAWQNQIAQFVARIDRSQAAIDKIQKDLDAQNAICNYPPTLVARDNACA